jgi:hypothetical protein
MRSFIVIVSTIVIAALGCSKDDPLSPESLAGIYPLAQVNGGDPSAYHPVGALNCTAAFQTGSLEIKRNHDFQLDIAYFYVCQTPSVNDGAGIITVYGDGARVINGVLYLDGCGPALTGQSTCPPWSLEVRKSSPNLAVRFLSTAALFWGDPTFTMGPRQ